VASALQGWVARKLLIGVGGLFCVPTDLSPRASMATFVSAVKGKESGHQRNLVLHQQWPETK